VQKRLMLVCGTIYDPRGLPGVSTADPGVDGLLQLISGCRGLKVHGRHWS
jgi:hypothetical protein